MYFSLCPFLLITKTNALPADNAEMVLCSIKPLHGNYSSQWKGTKCSSALWGKINESRGETKWCGHSDDSVDNNNKTDPLYYNVFRIVRQSEK